MVIRAVDFIGINMVFVACISPFMPYELCYPNRLDESICHFWDVCLVHMYYLHFILTHFTGKPVKG